MEKIRPSKSKVRVVRCPRCTSLLPEPTDVPLYTCGTCATLLQAKHYRKERERRRSTDWSSFSEHDEVDCGHGGEEEAAAPSAKLEQLGVSSFSKEVSLLNQLHLKDTCDLARLSLEFISNPMEQDEMEDQFGAIDSSSESSVDATTIKDSAFSSEPITTENKLPAESCSPTGQLLGDQEEEVSDKFCNMQKGNDRDEDNESESCNARGITTSNFMIASGSSNPYYECLRPRYLRHWIHDPYLHLYDSYVQPEDHTSRFYLRRRLHDARHICPMLAAAPFVSCYHCLELLELPLDFLVFKTRTKRNRVKCSSCSRILEFVVLDDNKYRRQLVPYRPRTMASFEVARDKGKRKMVDK